MSRYDEDMGYDPNYEEKCKSYRVKLIQDEFQKRKGVNQML